MGTPDVAVVIPAYRAARTLRRAVESVRATAPDAETIVVFDGPDAEAARSIADLKVVVVNRKHRSGAPACRNTGLAATLAPYVMFLDADDYLEGPLLLAALEASEASRADVTLAPFALEYPDGRRDVRSPRLRYTAAEPTSVLRDWLLERYTPPCAVLWRRTFLAELGGWDEGIAKNQDGDLVYRALALRPRIAFSERGLGVYVQDDDPRRITRSHDLRTLNSQLAVLDRVRAATTNGNICVEPELALAYYSLARLAYTHEADDLGAKAEASARALGLVDDPGPFAHRTLVGLFGLRAKQRIARLARDAVDRTVAAKERMWASLFSSASTGGPALSAPTSPTATAPRSQS